MGYLFCHDPRAAASHVEPITDIDALIRKPVTITPHPSFGQPGPADFKVFLAVLKKLSDYGRPVPDTVYFSQLEIVQLTDRVWSGRTGKQFLHSLHRLAATRVNMAFFHQQKEATIATSFSIPTEFTTEHKRGNIRSCSISIPKLIQRSLDDRFFSCLNYNRIRGVPTIQATLYIRLFHHFSNLQESGTRNSVQIRKSYSEICKVWLGGLTVLSHKSKIMQEQLGVHLNALVASKFLRSFSVDKNAAGDGFNITFLPGTGFHEDYNRFYKNRFQNELQFKFYEEKENIGYPMELVRRFHEQRTGEKITASHVTTAEQQYALTLIKELTFEGAQAFVEYGVKRARTSNYAVNSLAGLKTYYGDFLKKRDTLTKAKDAASARLQKEQNERDAAAYAEYRQAKADQLFAAAPADVQEYIDTTAIARAKAKGGILGQTPRGLIVRMERDKIIDQRFSIPTMEQWLARKNLN